MAYRIASNAHHPIVCNYLIMQRRYNGSRSMRTLTDLHLPFMSSLDKSCNVHHMEEGGDLASRLPVVAQPVISAVWHCHATCRGEGKEKEEEERKKGEEEEEKEIEKEGEGKGDGEEEEGEGEEEERRRRGGKGDRKEGKEGDGEEEEEKKEEEERKEETKEEEKKRRK